MPATQLQARLPKDAGISLIEVLIAVMIIGVISTAVVFSLQPGSDPLEEEADRLSARLIFASQEAIATGQPVGLVIEDFGAGYSFQRYIDGRWWPLAENPAFAQHAFEDNIRLHVLDALLRSADGDDAPPPSLPLLWFDPAGLTEPFALRLEDETARLEYRWETGAPDGWERVSG